VTPRPSIAAGSDLPVVLQAHTELVVYGGGRRRNRLFPAAGFYLNVTGRLTWLVAMNRDATTRTRHGRQFGLPTTGRTGLAFGEPGRTPLTRTTFGLRFLPVH